MISLSFLQFITEGVVLICRDRFRGRFRGGRAVLRLHQRSEADGRRAHHSTARGPEWRLRQPGDPGGRWLVKRLCGWTLACHRRLCSMLVQRALQDLHLCWSKHLKGTSDKSNGTLLFTSTGEI